jgi:hypothetical protein
MTPITLLRPRFVAALVGGIMTLAGAAQACVLCAPGVLAEAAAPNHCETGAHPDGRCSYLASTAGDISGWGAWVVSITRGTERIEVRGDNGTELRTLSAVIHAGDRVEAAAGPAAGAVNVGHAAAERPCPLP